MTIASNPENKYVAGVVTGAPAEMGCYDLLLESNAVVSLSLSKKGNWFLFSGEQAVAPIGIVAHRHHAPFFVAPADLEKLA